MPLIQRIADVLRFGHRTPHPDEHSELNLHQQLDRLADSRSVVESDLAREQRLADRLEAEGKKAIAAGADNKAQALADRRDTVLARINELRAAHRTLSDAITQRATAQTNVRNQQFPADESNHAVAEAEQHEKHGTPREVHT
ncbi:MAG: hypothetical protein HOV87_04440 [Catenulispora sp.]|nr:hypothetical protein [Catenulispora sp.]